MWGLRGRTKALLGTFIVSGLCLLSKTKVPTSDSEVFADPDGNVFLDLTSTQPEQITVFEDEIRINLDNSSLQSLTAKQEAVGGVLNELLDEYNRNMSSLRSRILSSLEKKAKWADLSVTTRPKLLASSIGFLEHVKEYFHVQLLETPRHQLHSVLRNQYYDYSSNDCATVETNSKGSGLFLKMWYNATCHSNMHDAIAPQAMLNRAPLFLRASLPPKSNLDQKKALLTYVILAEDAVLDANGDVITHSVEVVPARCRDTWVYDNLTEVDIETIPVYDEVFGAHQFFGKQFYHATVESLVRLVPYLAFLRRNPQIKIHLGFNHPFLPLLGIPNDRIVTDRVRARLVYMPAGGGCGNSPVFSTQLLSNTLRQSLGSVLRDTVVLIQRNPSKVRNFQRHDEIAAALEEETKKAGLRFAVFSDSPLPSLNQTVNMFSRAVVVVSPHGAGAANLLLANPGTVLVEALHPGPSNYPNLCFASLSQALGLRYHGLFNDSGVRETSAEDLRTPVHFYLTHLSHI